VEEGKWQVSSGEWKFPSGVLRYHAVDERSRLKEWHPGKIFTGAKRSPKLFFDYEAKAAA
jgi:hypothetical protein